MKQRFYLYLYSSGNLLGCLFGLIGLGLFFAGWIRLYWLAIVLGLYLLGFLLAPARRRLDLRMVDARMDVGTLLDALDDLLRKVRKKAPKEVLDILASIRASFADILPRLAKDTGTPYEAHVIRQTAQEYLPEMLEIYLALPPAFARLHPLKDGKTATKILIEQLELLDAEMKRLAEDILRDDTQALLAHGAFLKEKFAKPGQEWLGVR